MSVIAAAAMRVRTMADGSLRIEVEVQPADAQAAFAMFGRPGAPMALAALHDGYAKASDAPVSQQDVHIDTRKPCTCDGAGRGPGRNCVAQAGGRLGELWRCAKGIESSPAPPAKRSASTKPIAQWLALMCRRPEFQRWMCGPDDASEANAAQMCRTACSVESRGDIDGNAEAEATFREQIQHPWQKFCADHGITFVD